MKKDNTNAGFKVIREESKTNSIYRTLMLVILVAFITFILTSVGMYTVFSKKDPSVQNLASLLTKDTGNKGIEDKLNAYRQIIDKHYLGEVDEEKLQEGAIAGYIKGLGDKYSEYVPKSEMEDYTDDLTGNFVGIGVYIVEDTKTNSVVILAPMKESPAEKAGLKSGDIIKSVDGVEYTGDKLSEVSKNIKGEEGSEADIIIDRDGKEMEFKIKRQNVAVNPVEAKVLENNIGYISFASFDEKTSDAFKNKYNELKNQGIKSLIIDLRNNGGGIVDEAINIAGTILQKDSVVLYEIDKNKNEKEEKTSTDPIIDVPIVVLVNENTASSSEILVAALKDYGKAKIVGQKTFGKGIIQELLGLPDGSGIKLTNAEYLTPNRNKINEVGIEPDESVELPKDVKSIINVEKEKDTQLQKAIEMLK